ncbi:MAG: hypothetical protein A3F67_10375 [Verrucomicrobia bacterium RIFCSPHIGHO2_12_FULL_41_10]|nr:MAG: hypothetical protein A3F67_10375 [Verrucomicrobia bacterium RIFCSPHIGHO2_12_FULL_41_10]
MEDGRWGRGLLKQVNSDKYIYLTLVFHTDRDEKVAKANEARQVRILAQGCMSTYCPSQNRNLTLHSSVFPTFAVD